MPATTQETLTVGELRELLESRHPDSPVYIQRQGNLLWACSTVDSYAEHELIRSRLGISLVNVEHLDFDTDEEAVVVLGSE